MRCFETRSMKDLTAYIEPLPTVGNRAHMFSAR